MTRRSLKIHRAKAGLVVIDVQERLLPAIHEHERVLQNTIRLIKGAGVLKVPVFMTEQYPKGLGRTAAEIRGAAEGCAVVEKTRFSACGASAFQETLKEKHITDAVLCGIEAHVCVSQTCLDLLEHGHRVFVVADAISSRTEENRQVALLRMQEAGAIIVSTEMILFELLEEAGTDEFRHILALVK
jgi:nicotinamidase-related amidase